MGFSISDIGSAISNVVDDAVGEVSKIPDPISMGIEAAGGALGIDPKITGMIECGIGAVTGDAMCAVHGANDILNSRTSDDATDRMAKQPAGYHSSGGGAAPAGANASTPSSDGPSASTSPNPPAASDTDDSSSADDTSDASNPLDNTAQLGAMVGTGSSSTETFQDAVQTLADNFDLFDTASGVGSRDGLVSKGDLQAILNNPDAPADVKAAAKFLLDNPSYFNELECAQYGGKLDGLIGKGDVQAMLAKLEGQKAAAPTSNDASSGAADAGTTAGSTPAPATTSDASAPAANPTTTSNASGTSADDSSTPHIDTSGATLEDKLGNMTSSLQQDLDDMSSQLANATDPAQIQKLSTQMNYITEMLTLVSNMQKSLHDLQMSIINNIR